jgi:hypothetical protein
MLEDVEAPIGTERDVDHRREAAPRNRGRVAGDHAVDVRGSSRKRHPCELADVVGAIRTHGDRGRHGIGQPALRARGEDRERRNGAVRRDAEQCVRAGVGDDPASRLGKQAVGVAVEQSATWVECELVRGDVGNRPPAAARR